MKISKILSYVVLAIGAIGAILLFLMSGNFTTLMDNYGITEAKDLVKDTSSSAFAEATSLVSPMYNLTLVIFVVIIIATLVAVFSALAKNPSGLKNAGIGIVAFLVIICIAYVMANGEETPMKDGEILSVSGSKWVGTGIWSFYFLGAVAVGLMVLSGVKKLIGK
ncbi:phosphoethanolamine transferase domain-containing protein [uncultured Aquimarina sp.]|uniref:phosphoethanolamine transferase domain-containing protein n=1 Tax=uncultured Aquimarina sp. TaxID=575652 RepID=UPI0026297A10|nr:phosphoethanolamine transferase domain-containing protein [uncultured Aquimarina sp.]